ncbi:Cys-tRNA(Pro) deacylase [Marinobacter sp. ELB17]|uniref:Cys-tRNA(Pro) deacylase n=1 Tax=Marinobacter sp. ELB17 TaxID=270374 RepID=UPI0000F376B5|nr:Cys-tRNA(Pro) deacylase [Marinobacter sp. ELB17]EBA00843.1 ybaK/ebsC protein [Marinobacter sp. ELB17]
MTPAIDVAREAGIEHQLHQYQRDPASAGYGTEAAEKLGLNPACVFKTLVVEVDAKTLVVAIVPVNAMLSMKLIAKAASGKKAIMADKQQVQRSSGYILGGVSPLGQKRPLTTFIDESAQLFERIHVSAGRRGLEIELAPEDLATLTQGRFVALRQE